ncbi:MAG: N-acetyltransferase family protein [Dongiaceae bacterium]
MSGGAAAPAVLAVRDATAADMALLQAIYAHHVRHGLASFEELPPDRAEMDRRREEAQGRGLPYLVVETADGVQGFASAGPYRSRPAYRFTVEDSVYVAPGAAGRGLGRAALGAVIERCTALGLRQMVAVIGDSANAASIGLHRALWFVPTGTLRSVGFKHGRWVDSVLMQRPLGPGDAAPPIAKV